MGRGPRSAGLSAGLLSLVLLLGPAGCGCATRFRSIELEQTTANTRGYFAINQTRTSGTGPDFGNGMVWSVEATLPPGVTVTGVMLIVGTPTAPGAVLYNFPLVPYPGTTIITHSSGIDYPFDWKDEVLDELREKVRSGPGFLNR